MMNANLDTAIAMLERTPKALNAMLRDLPDAWTHCNEGGETWSVFDVVGHLIHADLDDWVPRARWILEFGESKPFPPFDRGGHRQITLGKSLAQLLDEFAQGTFREAERAAWDEFADCGFGTSRTAFGAWLCYAVATACHMGGTRLESSASDFTDHGESIS